jgi:ABC-2 type transport system ATP-binding protein
MPDNNGNPIAIHELALAYGNHRVLDGLSLTVPASSITALLGGNGAGKSTTLSADALPISPRTSRCTSI